MPQSQRAAGSPFPALLAKLGSPGTHFSPTIAFFKTCVFRGKFQKGDGLGRILGYLGKPTCTQTFPNQFQPVWPRTTNTNEKAMRECLGNFGKLWETLENLGKPTKTKLFQKIPTGPEQKQPHFGNWVNFAKDTDLQSFLSMPLSVCRCICVYIGLCVFRCVYIMRARFYPNLGLQAAV